MRFGLAQLLAIALLASNPLAQAQGGSDVVLSARHYVSSFSCFSILTKKLATTTFIGIFNWLT